MDDRRSAAGSARMERLLDGPVVPTLLALAAPMTLVLTVQASISVIETYFVGTLGAGPLAGVTLVFPIIMLMQMVASGGLGGGIASAVARATGAGAHKRAMDLAGHGMALATIAGLLCAAGGLAAGPMIYRALGGTGPELAAALSYSNVIFAGMVLLWWSNALASALRGSGEMIPTAIVILVAATASIALMPCLIEGWGPFPQLGLVGAGLALLAYHALCTAGFLIALARSHGGFAFRRASQPGRGFKGALFADILSVGGLSTIMTLQSSLAVVVITSLAAGFGSLILAGYGIGSRLDALLVPPLFGLGAATVTMVGVNVGAGRLGRAERIAWLGALVAAAALEAIGLFVAAFPRVWLRLFSADHAVLAAGSHYLRTVAPFYGFLGVGTILHFAALGAGRPGGPLTAISARVLVAAGGGALVVHALGRGQHQLYVMVAAGLVAFALVHAGFVLNGSLRRPRAAPGRSSLPVRPPASAPGRPAGRPAGRPPGRPTIRPGRLDRVEPDVLGQEPAGQKAAVDH